MYEGLVGGGAFGYARSVTASPETLRARRIRAAFDVIYRPMLVNKTHSP